MVRGLGLGLALFVAVLPRTFHLWSSVGRSSVRRAAYTTCGKVASLYSLREISLCGSPKELKIRNRRYRDL